MDPIHPRRELRYRAQEGAVAFHESKIGQILDVSRGGIAFQYVAAPEESPDRSPLRIIFSRRSFDLPDLQTQEIYDLPVQEEPPFSCLRIRRRGLAFLELSAPQSSALDHFIEYHTLGPV